MPIQKTITLYHYHELSERAKERAREWWQRCIDSSDYGQALEDAVKCASALGIEIDTVESRTLGGGMRSDPDIRWSGFASQGDGASFNGMWKYPEWNIVARIKQHAPQDLTLHSIANVMHGMYEKYQKYHDTQKLVVRCQYSNSGVSYAHSGWMDVECELVDNDLAEDNAVTPEDSKIITSTLRGFADWIYDQLREQHNYLTSEEVLAETMEANQYTFTAEGKRE